MADGDSGSSWLKGAGPFLTMGMQLAGAVVVFFFIGRWLDRTLDTAPWLTVVAVLLGVTGGFISFFRTVKEIGKREEQEMHTRREKEKRREN